MAARRPGGTTSVRNSARGVVGGIDGAAPIRPYGFTTSTTAITTNSATSVSFGKSISKPPRSTVPSAMHRALVRPMRSAATKAPGIEPKPPATVTTNASAMTARSMPRLAGSRGSCNAPASPARQDPSANTRVKSLPRIDAKRAREGPILGRRADERAEARSFQQSPQREQNERPDGEQEKVIGRNHAAEHRQRPAQSRSAGSEQILGAPDEQGRVADDEHDAERGGELQQFRRGVNAFQQQHLDRCADQADQERREEDGAPESERAAGERRDERVGDERAQHVKGAVREVDDARDAEDQREARGDQEQRRRAGEAVQELSEKGGEGHARGRSCYVGLPISAKYS